MPETKWPRCDVSKEYDGVTWVSVRRSMCSGLIQPDIGAMLAATIRADGLEPKEGWNSDGIPADILFRAAWVIEKNEDGTYDESDGTYQHDLFMVPCVKANA